MDFRFTLRLFRKNPGFTLLAIAILAIGIGANTAVFSVLNAVVLKPLAYGDADRIVTLEFVPKKGGLASRGAVSAPNFRDWESQSTAFDAMAFYGSQQPSVMVGQQAEFTQITFVSPQFFRVFAVEPIFGRLFTAEEEQMGGPSAVVVGHAFWVRHFGASGFSPGKIIRVFQKPLEIVGVMPPTFTFPAYSALHPTEMWAPADTIFGFGRAGNRSANILTVVARLKTGVSVVQAQTQMTAIAERLEQQYPASNRDKTARVTHLRDQMVAGVKPTLYLLLGGVAVVLLISCANVANLLLAKAAARTREIAIRAALGAGRDRIIRQLLTESTALAAVSGVAGLILALLGTRALIALAPASVPRLAETAVIDRSVLAFTLSVAVLASVLFGIAPAIAASRVDLIRALKQSGHYSLPAARRMRQALVVAEIALSVILLTGAGLLLKSFVALSNVALGFRPENLLVMEINIPATTFAEERRATQLDKKLLQEIAAIPGISAVGSLRLPPGKPFLIGDYWIDRLPGPEAQQVSAPQAVFSPVAPGTFATLGIPLKRGRDFNDSDTLGAPYSAVINETLARKSFPGQDPIDRAIVSAYVPNRPLKIIGVAGDVRQIANREPLPEIYLPYQQHPYWGLDLSIVARAAAGQAGIAQAMRKKLREVAPDAFVRFTTAQASLSENIATPRFRTILVGIFSAIALGLAMAGVYGVITYAVSNRVTEIGLRMALGAGSGNVLSLVLREAAALACIGLAVGLAGAAATSRLIASMLFEVKATDPIILTGVSVLLAALTILASYIPARRATKIDPLVALRQE